MDIARLSPTPEVRTNALTGERAIIAPARAGRPGTGVAKERRPALPAYAADCPFCPGNEELTTGELLRIPATSHRPWRVRVVENKYPALVREGGDGPWGPGATSLCPVEPALGRHEVTVDSPYHNRRFTDFAADQLLAVMQAYRERFAAAAAEERVQHIVIFRNHGKLANASMIHPHSQVAALSFVPPRVASLTDRSQRYLAAHRRPLLLDIVEDELADGARVVDRLGDFLIFVPYAPGHDSEVWVAPRTPLPGFGDCDDARLLEAGRALRLTLETLRLAADDPDYTYILHTPPPRGDAERALPWFFQVVPRLTPAAGFEMASGVRIVTTPPEQLAASLRAALATVARV